MTQMVSLVWQGRTSNKRRLHSLWFFLSSSSSSSSRRRCRHRRPRPLRGRGIVADLVVFIWFLSSETLLRLSRFNDFLMFFLLAALSVPFLLLFLSFVLSSSSPLSSSLSLSLSLSPSLRLPLLPASRLLDVTLSQPPCLSPPDGGQSLDESGSNFWTRRSVGESFGH